MYVPGDYHNNPIRATPFQSPSGGGGGLGFFRLVEDMPAGHGSRAWSEFLNWDKDVIGSGWLYNWGVTAAGIIGFYPAGLFGTYGLILGRKAFNQAECGQKCVTGTYIPTQTPTGGTVGQEGYSYTPSVTGPVIANSFTASGLPSGWSFSSSDGTITGPTSAPGIVGPARQIEIIISALANKTGGGGSCAITRRLLIDIDE